MKAAVITFPGSNCDRDLAVAFEKAGADVVRVWHKDAELPRGIDIVGIPGGFSFGDYLRCGAIAAQSPVMRSVADFVHAGGHALGICNGFQVLTETGLLPGALMRNAGLKFVCKPVDLRVATADSVFTSGWAAPGFPSRITTATTRSTPRDSRGSGTRTASPLPTWTIPTARRPTLPGSSPGTAASSA